MLIEDVLDTGIIEPCPIATLDGFSQPPENPRLIGPDGRLTDAVTSVVTWGNFSATLSTAAVFKLIENGHISLAGADRNFAGLLATAVADLGVTGTRAHADFRSITAGSAGFDIEIFRRNVMRGVAPAALRLGTTGTISADANQAAVRSVVDRALAVVWALHGPTAHRLAQRSALGWIAVSAEHDQPIRPVNVPASPWPTRDLDVTVGHHGRETRCRMRYAIAGATDFSTTSPSMGLPNLDTPPVIDPEADVLIFIHGHSSRLEEAGGIYAALAAEKSSCSPHEPVLIAFDLPTHGYSEYIDHEMISPLHETHFVPDHPEQRKFGMLEFLEISIVAFAEALDAEMVRAGQPGILHRIAAIIGGSLGGNLCLRLSEKLVTNPSWLKSLVAWSPASTPTSLGRSDLAIGSPGERWFDPAGKEALDRTRDRCDDAEDSNSRANHFRIVLSGERLINDGTPGFEALTRFAGFLLGPIGQMGVETIANVVALQQSDEWLREECREGFDSGARTAGAVLSLAETYNAERRRMHWRVAFEQLLFSHQDEIIASRGRACFQISTVPLLLIVGANDNTDHYEIYNSVRGFAPGMTSNPGRALFVRNTGHSIHEERPKWLARRIHAFLCERQVRFLPPHQLIVAPDTGGSAGNDLWAMYFNRPARRWEHMNRLAGHPLRADLNCDLGLPTPTTFGVKFAVVGDFDGDGQDEIAVAPDIPASGGNDFWVMKFDPRARHWAHLSQISGHPFGADLNCDDIRGVVPTRFGVKFAVAGDFDGDGRQELIVAPDTPGTAGNDLWAMKFNPVSRQWMHMSPIPGHPFGADLNCDDIRGVVPTRFGVKFAVAGDFDGDGRQELVIAPDTPGTEGNDLWAMKFDPVSRQWTHMSPISGHRFGADMNCDVVLGPPGTVGVKFAVVGDFDGDGQDEIALAPDVSGTGGNDFWVMKFNRMARRWEHMNPFAGHPLRADLNCDLGLPASTTFGVKFAVVGDFDGDGRDEIAVAPDIPGSGGNDFWVMKFDPRARHWVHLSPMPGHPFGADLNCDLGLARPTDFGVKFAAVGDFDGDGQDEIAVAPDVAVTGGNDFWVMKFDRTTNQWVHLSPLPGHRFGADLNCDVVLGAPAAFGVKFAAIGRFNMKR